MVTWTVTSNLLKQIQKITSISDCVGGTGAKFQVKIFLKIHFIFQNGSSRKIYFLSQMLKNTFFPQGVTNICLCIVGMLCVKAALQRLLHIVQADYSHTGAEGELLCWKFSHNWGTNRRLGLCSKAEGGSILKTSISDLQSACPVKWSRFPSGYESIFWDTLISMVKAWIMLVECRNKQMIGHFAVPFEIKKIKALKVKVN